MSKQPQRSDLPKIHKARKWRRQDKTQADIKASTQDKLIIKKSELNFLYRRHEQ